MFKTCKEYKRLDYGFLEQKCISCIVVRWRWQEMCDIYSKEWYISFCVPAQMNANMWVLGKTDHQFKTKSFNTVYSFVDVMQDIHHKLWYVNFYDVFCCYDIIFQNYGAIFETVVDSL